MDESKIEKIIKDDEIEHKQNQKRKFIMKILFVSVCILIILLLIVPVNSTIVGDLNKGNGKYEIDCLGVNNELFIYKDEGGAPTLSYRRNCDGFHFVKQDLIETASYLELRNLETNSDFLYFKEVLTKIDETKVDIKKTEFTDKVCIEVKSPKYTDISIGGIVTPQTKDVYQCVAKDTLQSNTIEILVNKKLIKQETFTKENKVTISIKDFSLINPSMSNIVNIEFRNPAKNPLKIQIIDSNLACERKSFTLGDKFVMGCNVTNTDALTYFIQAKTSTGEILYKDLSKPVLPSSGSNTNWWYWIIALVIAVVVYFNGKVKGSDKKALQELGEEDDKERDRR